MPTTTATKNQLWEIDCAPECGFMVREHNQKALLAETQAHLKMVHNWTKTDKEILGMARKV